MLRSTTRLISGLGALRSTASIHFYSSNPSVEPDVAQLQQELLNTAAKYVKQVGWTRECLLQAARDLQLSPAAASMFPRGAAELVEHVIRRNNAELAAELQANQQQFLTLPLPQRIAAAVKRRLEMNVPYMDSWPQALAVLAQPRNSPETLKLLLQLLDEIWYAAGDTSTDASWYTKRATLAAIYTSTELYMLTDYSPGYTDTWQQLERRIQDALWLSSTAASMAAIPQQLITAVLEAINQSSAGSSSSYTSSSSAAADAASAAADAASAAADAAASALPGSSSGHQAAAAGISPHSSSSKHEQPMMPEGMATTSSSSTHRPQSPQAGH